MSLSTSAPITQDISSILNDLVYSQKETRVLAQAVIDQIPMNIPEQSPIMLQLVELLEKFKASYRQSTSTHTLPEDFKDNTQGSELCSYCQQKNHKLSLCDQFTHISPLDRLRFVFENNLCRICFNSTHPTKDCRVTSCFRCNRNHHVLLHESYVELVKPTKSRQNSSPTSMNSAQPLSKGIPKKIHPTATDAITLTHTTDIPLLNQSVRVPNSLLENLPENFGANSSTPGISNSAVFALPMKTTIHSPTTNEATTPHIAGRPPTSCPVNVNSQCRKFSQIFAESLPSSVPAVCSPLETHVHYPPEKICNICRETQTLEQRSNRRLVFMKKYFSTNSREYFELKLLHFLSLPALPRSYFSVPHQKVHRLLNSSPNLLRTRLKSHAPHQDDNHHHTSRQDSLDILFESTIPHQDATQESFDSQNPLATIVLSPQPRSFLRSRCLREEVPLSLHHMEATRNSFSSTKLRSIPILTPQTRSGSQGGKNVHHQLATLLPLPFIANTIHSCDAKMNKHRFVLHPKLMELLKLNEKFSLKEVLQHHRLKGIRFKMSRSYLSTQSPHLATNENNSFPIDLATLLHNLSILALSNSIATTNTYPQVHQEILSNVRTFSLAFATHGNPSHPLMLTYAQQLLTHHVAIDRCNISMFSMIWKVNMHALVIIKSLMQHNIHVDLSLYSFSTRLAVMLSSLIILSLIIFLGNKANRTLPEKVKKKINFQAMHKILSDGDIQSTREKISTLTSPIYSQFQGFSSAFTYSLYIHPRLQTPFAHVAPPTQGIFLTNFHTVLHYGKVSQDVPQVPYSNSVNPYDAYLKSLLHSFCNNLPSYEFPPSSIRTKDLWRIGIECYLRDTKTWPNTPTEHKNVVPNHITNDIHGLKIIKCSQAQFFIPRYHENCLETFEFTRMLSHLSFHPHGTKTLPFPQLSYSITKRRISSNSSLQRIRTWGGITKNIRERCKNCTTGKIVSYNAHAQFTHEKITNAPALYLPHTYGAPYLPAAHYHPLIARKNHHFLSHIHHKTKTSATVNWQGWSTSPAPKTRLTRRMSSTSAAGLNKSSSRSHQPSERPPATLNSRKDYRLRPFSIEYWGIQSGGAC